MQALFVVIFAGVLVLNVAVVNAQRSSLPPTRVLNSIFTEAGVDYLETFTSGNSAGFNALIQPLYDELDAAWWKWALTYFVGLDVPSPFSDVSGEECLSRQEGEIYYLAGSFDGSGNVTTRSLCQIPANKWLFFPIVNQLFFATNETEFEDIISLLPSTESFQDLGLMIDGEDFTTLIRPTSSSTLNIPSPVDDNANVAKLNDIFTTLPTPTIPFGFTTGAFAFVPPLTLGEHTISFTGLNAASDFKINTEYAPITVVEEIDEPLPVVEMAPGPLPMMDMP